MYLKFITIFNVSFMVNPKVLFIHKNSDNFLIIWFAQGLLILTTLFIGIITSELDIYIWRYKRKQYHFLYVTFYDILKMLSTQIFSRKTTLLYMYLCCYSQRYKCITCKMRLKITIYEIKPLFNLIVRIL